MLISTAKTPRNGENMWQITSVGQHCPKTSVAETRTQPWCFLFCIFPFQSVSSNAGVMFFPSFPALAVKEICRLFWCSPEQEQHNPGTCSDRHLNMQRMSLITLTRLEGESDGGRSRRGKSKTAPGKGSPLSQTSLSPAQCLLLLVLTHCRELSLCCFPDETQTPSC